MQEDRIKESLENKFNADVELPYKRHIVFWYDEEGTYENFYESLDIPNVKKEKITKNRKGLVNNLLPLKIKLEIEDTSSNFLIYAPFPRPIDSENFLLNIEMYSEEYIADDIAMLLEEYGLTRDYRDYIKTYFKFFRSDTRKTKLKKLMEINPTKFDFELCLLAAATNTKNSDFEEIILSIFSRGIEDRNTYYDEMGAAGLTELFWKKLEDLYGLSINDKTLRTLMKTLLLIHMYYTTKQAPPLELSPKAKANSHTIYVFVEHWLEGKNKASYLDLASQLENEIGIYDKLQSLDFNKILSINTFKSVDHFVLTKLANVLINNLNDYDEYIEWINTRRDITPWGEDILIFYKVLYNAIELLKIGKDYIIAEDEVEEIFEAYSSTYYKIDRHYRKFYENYDLVKTKSNDSIDKIKDIVEKLYQNKLLALLDNKWSKSLMGIKDNYKLVNYINQYDFYKNYIATSKERVFVIISDALRYEVAEELREKLLTLISNNTVEMETMLGNVPSYTRLGMASLLPHNNKLEFKNDSIFIDGKDVKDTSSRQVILERENPNSIAVTYNKFVKDMSRTEARELIKGKEIIYIYHDKIDDTGEHRNEIEVFKACSETIQELIEGIKFLVNGFSASNIIITADHGFIYQRDLVEDYDKLDLGDVNYNGSANKRYVYTDKEIKKDGTISFDLSYIFKDQKLNALIPKENLRFKAAGGGINYVHGGASLQEVVIPVIKYKNIRNKSVEISKVDLHLLSVSRRIKNNTSTFKFVQSEPVNEENKVLPRNIRVGIYDSEILISNEKQLYISSTEENTGYEIMLTLKAGTYSSSKDYRLKVIDKDSSETLLDEKYIIDIGIANEFF